MSKLLLGTEDPLYKRHGEDLHEAVFSWAISQLECNCFFLGTSISEFSQYKDRDSLMREEAVHDDGFVQKKNRLQR